MTATLDVDSHTATRTGRVPAAIPALGALMLATASWFSRSSLPVDDAAITFRYATRLATGHGLTYNDGEHVLGVSSGLHTLLIAGMHALGLPPAGAAIGIGLAGAAASGALVAYLAYRLSGRTAAVVAVVILLAGPYRIIATTGMEAPLSIALGLAAIAAAHNRRDLLAGVLLGLALWTKLDAGAVIVAVTAARWAVDRAAPVRMLKTATATALPWYLWATIIYGNPLPQSLLSKLSGRADEPGFELDPTWALRGIVVLLPIVLVAGWFLACRRPGDDGAWITHLSLAGWFVIHLAAASLLPLGSQYGWYLAALVAPLAVVGGCGAAQAFSEVRSRSRGRGAVAVAVLALLSLSVVARSVVVDADPGLRPTDTDRFVMDLRDAGRWIDRYHPGETVLSCLGWIAFEAPDNRIIDPCQLTTEATNATAVIVVGTDGDAETNGDCELARFDRHQQAESDRPVTVLRGPCRLTEGSGE